MDKTSLSLIQVKKSLFRKKSLELEIDVNMEKMKHASAVTNYQVN